MTDPIRVLHFADVHVGMENYGKTDPDTGLSSRVVDFLRRMDDMVAYAQEGDVDLVIFAGDAFKTRTPNPTYQREFAWRIQDLAELAPVVLLVGNHDLPPNALKASSIEIYHTLAVPNVTVAQDYEVHRITTKRGDVLVGAAPYPIRSRLMQQMDNSRMTIKQADQQLEENLTTILDDLAAQADAQGSDELPRLLTGHFTVRGAVLGSERNVMLGRDVQVSLNLMADPRWDYVALGHVHKHQNLTHGQDDVPPVVYSGSLERIDFGEEGDVKGFCWVELERGSTRWQFVPVQARPMVTLRINCTNDPNPTRTVIGTIRKHALDAAIVRLIIQLRPETDAALNDKAVRDALRRGGAFYVAGIRREIERPERPRLDNAPESLSHEELLEAFFRQKGYEADYRQRLLDAAREIIAPDET